MPIFPGLNHVLMKRFLRIFLAVALLCVATDAFAQRLSGSNYATVGYIKSDGTIQDSSYRTIGHIKSDGTVQDGSYRTIGHIKSDGTIQDSSYRTIGHIKSDGTVQDGSYRTIGHASGVKREWAAFCFFFF